MIRARHSILVLSGVSLLAVTACTDPAMVGNGDNPYQKTQQGALLGGLIGAGLGAAVSDDRAKGALIGGALGAAGGATYGSMLDKQEAELRQQLDDNRVQITNTGDRLIVTLPQDILFDVDSASVRAGLRDDLMTVASSLRDYPDSTVQVVGHTDNTGDAGYNQQLSERRANAVADVLMDGGVAFSRIQTFGRGENQPVADNLTDAGRAQNRRVEIVILPNAA
jgi:outer membrane protein OmpA-like peptidoglycan-associated protein